MLTSGSSRLWLLTLLGALVAAASAAPGASAATQRYASPNGSGTDCSAAIPCTIREAVENADTYDEVIVGAGDYPLTATLSPKSAHVTIHGVAGNARPRLLLSGANHPELSLSYATLRYVEIDQAEPTRAFWVWKTNVDQTVVRGAGYQCTAEIRDSTVRNSLFIAPSMNVGATVCTSANGSYAGSTYRNVTAIAKGGGNGVAIMAHALGPAGYANIKATNVIADAPGSGFKALTDSSGAHATITVNNSNFQSQGAVGTNAAIISGGGNQSAWPKFVNAAADDYRQATASPTIDAGLDEFLNGDFDLDGDPRHIGSNADIGADEYFVAPTAATGPASVVTDQSATLTGSVNPNGASTAYWFEYGPTSAYGRTTLSVDAGSGTGGIATTTTVVGLSPATTYHYRLVATNGGVTTEGADKTLTTASPPATAPSSPTTTSPSPATPSTPSTPSTPPAPAAMPAFAGVKLVSSKLSFGGRFVTLKLSCPAGTIGRCSGRTKLAARRRATSGAASTVVLGRAPFSIAAGRQAKVKVRVSRAGRRLLGRVRRLRGTDVNAARDGAGRLKTTVAAVTIRRQR
jgi:hypothetical protein